MAFPCFWKKAKRLQKLCSPKGTRCCSAMVGMFHLRPIQPCHHSTPSRGKNLDIRLKPVENKWSRTCAKDQSGKDRMPGEDYEIQEGDCVSSVAFSHGFFWETLWNHGNNSELKSRRKDPNILQAGDILHIPELTPRDESAASEKKHRFKLKGATSKSGPRGSTAVPLGKHNENRDTIPKRCRAYHTTPSSSEASDQQGELRLLSCLRIRRIAQDLWRLGALPD